MKTNSEIAKETRIAITDMGVDGGVGIIILPSGLHASVIWSNGGGWDHVSVSPFKLSKTPTWEDMCFVKDKFFYKNETAIEYHPDEENYVNNVGNCLHIWRPQNHEILMPPSIMVGLRKYQTIESAIQEANKL